MWVVVSYDIPDDGRRARLHDRLAGYLTRVQKSVFEGDVGARAFARMVRMIAHRIAPEEDDVRVYRLCPGCARSTLLLGVAPPVGDGSEPIVV